MSNPAMNAPKTGSSPPNDETAASTMTAPAIAIRAVNPAASLEIRRSSHPTTGRITRTKATSPTSTASRGVNPPATVPLAATAVSTDSMSQPQVSPTAPDHNVS